ncbi:MAG: YegS/Rv2252/BmrU family lipid kinase [Clostridia bacterium]|nr:YegS/Rv2252/BmrU family lipid kinase [Clostridia bacterium]
MLVPKKNMLLVVNPCAGKMTIKHHLLSVINIFSSAGFNVNVYPTKCRGDAEQIVFNTASHYSDIVCCGGDGTLNEVINGIMLSGANVNLGYIACGTLNEWSQGLKISKNMVNAAKDIACGNIIPLDIGKFAGKYFAYTASFGAFTDASYSAPQDFKNVLGQAAYIIEGIKSLSNIKPIPIEFECKEKSVKGDYLFGAISNSMSVGGIVKFDKALVALNDGRFEVFLIKHPKNAAQLQTIITAVLSRNFNCELIDFFHTEQVTVKAPANLAWTLDGEMASGGNKFTISNIHNAINFYIPEKFSKK